VTVAPSFTPVPTTVRTNLPLAFRVTPHDTTVGSALQTLKGRAPFTVTWIPCSLPIGHVPLAADRLRLLPLRPLAKIRNVFPAFADPKRNNASVSVGDNTTNLVACITFAEFAMSTANTDVTLVVPFGRMKQAPVTGRSASLNSSEVREGHPARRS